MGSEKGGYAGSPRVSLPAPEDASDLNYWWTFWVKGTRRAWRDKKYVARFREQYPDCVDATHAYLTTCIHPLEKKLKKRLTRMPALDVEPTIHNELSGGKRQRKRSRSRSRSRASPKRSRSPRRRRRSPRRRS